MNFLKGVTASTDHVVYRREWNKEYEGSRRIPRFESPEIFLSPCDNVASVGGGTFSGVARGRRDRKCRGGWGGGGEVVEKEREWKSVSEYKSPFGSSSG